MSGATVKNLQKQLLSLGLGSLSAAAKGGESSIYLPLAGTSLSVQLSRFIYRVARTLVLFDYSLWTPEALLSTVLPRTVRLRRRRAIPVINSATTPLNPHNSSGETNERAPSLFPVEIAPFPGRTSPNLTELAA